MKIIKPSFEMLSKVNSSEIMQLLELSGRTCYKSEDKITPESATTFVRKLINSGHEAMIEHYNLTVKIICDRGVTHEIVRHRIASYAQESTRYCNYSKENFGKELTFILPEWFEYGVSTYIKALANDSWRDIDPSEKAWMLSMAGAEKTYMYLLENGWSPQQARSVLPNSLKTEIVVTMNLREWRHFFRLRTEKAAHPQMQEIARPMLNYFKKILPAVFEDIE